MRSKHSLVVSVGLAVILLALARHAKALSYVDLSNPQELAENVVQYQHEGRWYSYMLCYGGWPTARAMDDLLSRGLTTRYVYRGTKICYRHTDVGTGKENWLPLDVARIPTTFAPGTIWQQMETARGSTIQGNWQWDPARCRFVCRWQNGAVATIQMTSRTGTQVVLDRRDWSGATKGLTAHYEGWIQGDRVKGSVTFSWEGRTWRGIWSARITHQPVNTQ